MTATFLFLRIELVRISVQIGLRNVLPIVWLSRIQTSRDANSFKVILPNLNWILNDGVNDGINDGVNFDSLILKIVKTNPGVRVPQIKQELSSIGYSLNELQIENRIRRNLKGKIKFEGAPKNGGYVIVKQ